MNLKSELVPLFFCFFLIILSLAVNAGCVFKYRPIFDNLSLNCFKDGECVLDVNGTGCIKVNDAYCASLLILENFCEDNLSLNYVQDCSLITKEDAFHTSEDIARMKSFIHKNYFEIPHNWLLGISPPNNKNPSIIEITLFLIEDNTMGREGTVTCNVTNFKLNYFSLELEKGTNKYLVEGHYVPGNYDSFIKKQSETKIGYWILFFFVLLIFLLILYSNIKKDLKKKKSKR